MTRIEAYRILSKMWNDATPEQDEAINIAMDCIEFVDLMPDDMVAVVRCRDCAHITPVEGGLPFCALHNIARAYNDFCSDGTRVGGD